MVEAISPLQVRVLVTVGLRGDPEAFGSQPENVMIARYAPQTMILPHECSTGRRCSWSWSSSSFATAKSIVRRATTLSRLSHPNGERGGSSLWKRACHALRLNLERVRDRYVS